MPSRKAPIVLRIKIALLGESSGVRPTALMPCPLSSGSFEEAPIVEIEQCAITGAPENQV